MFKFSGTVYIQCQIGTVKLQSFWPLNKVMDYYEISRTSPGESGEKYHIKPTPTLPKGLILILI